MPPQQEIIFKCLLLQLEKTTRCKSKNKITNSMNSINFNNNNLNILTTLIQPVLLIQSPSNLNVLENHSAKKKYQTRLITMLISSVFLHRKGLNKWLSMKSLATLPSSHSIITLATRMSPTKTNNKIPISNSKSCNSLCHLPRRT
jgi:hypothetical protein